MAGPRKQSIGRSCAKRAGPCTWRTPGILGLDVYGTCPKLEATSLAYVDSASDPDD